LAPINQPTDLISIIQGFRRELDELRRTVGLSSATINRGGLSLLNDAFLKMVSAAGIQIAYLGPDPDIPGTQCIILRRTDGSTVLYTYTHAPSGNQFWALTDKNGRILASDDAASGIGLARPWLSVPMYPLFSQAASSTFGYPTIDAATIAAEKTLWKGRIPLVSHPKIEISGIWGQASGSNAATYRLTLNGTEMGTWTPGFEESRRTFDITSKIDQSNADLQVKVSATGTGLVAAGLFGVWMRQT
jgi:hypothetical protein